MLHIRVVAPHGRTGRLLETLAGLAGVRNLVILRGAARLPDEGDAVLFQIEHRNSASTGAIETRMFNAYLIDGAGHWVQQEQPAEVSRLLLAFLKEAAALRGSK